MLIHPNSIFRAVLLTVFISSLVACGGGDGGSVPAAKEKSLFNDLTLTFGGAGKGLVTLSPSGTVCDDTCVNTFTANTKVTLSHKASSGSRFIGWSGDAGCSEGEVTMTDAVNCAVIFDVDASVSVFDLTINLEGLGSGSVTSTPSGINCTTATCVGPFEKDSVVTLTAEPATIDNTFTGWTGDCTNMTVTTTVTMTAAKTCTANFDVKTSITIHNLIVTMAGAGSAKGRVTSNPSGIDCSAISCNKDFAVDTIVTLTATTIDTTSKFTGWSGSCSGATETTKVTMTAAKNCIATFELATVYYDLTVRSVGNLGTVKSNPIGINCNFPLSFPCSSSTISFPAGTVVTLTAAPSNVTEVFVKWSLDCNGTALGTTVTMDRFKTCDIEFKLARYNLSVTFAGTGGGSVTSDLPPSISCNTLNPNVGCSVIYDVNTNVIMKAYPDGVSTFGGWSGTGCGDIISMTADRNCIAVFN